MNGLAWQERIRALDTVRRTGHVRAVHATHLEAEGPAVPLGSICRIGTATEATGPLPTAEVIRVDQTSVSLALMEHGAGLMPGAVVTAVETPLRVAAGDDLLGRAIDALGRPIDDGPLVRARAGVALFGEPPSPLQRQSPAARLETGVRAIDGLLPLARGQRVGIFAPAGVGKTSLLAQLARQAIADVTVIALIGERGREVELLWSGLPPSIRRRSILVAATSDQTAAMRVRAAHQAMAQAEHWRAQGRHVLFLMDSVTRLAMALREIGLAAGEPPTVRAYTPSVFAALPKLVERAGAVRDGGAISAIMTVLSEAEESDDPLAETMRSLLDGHVILSRTLAEQGHFPAIDILRSVSRQAPQLLSRRQGEQVRRVGGWLAAFERSRMAREAGLHISGSDPVVDAAVERRAAVLDFLRQDSADHVPTEQAERALAALVEDAHG